MAVTDLNEAVKRDRAPERSSPRPKAARRLVLRYAGWLVLLALAVVLEMGSASGTAFKLATAAFAVGVVGLLIIEEVP